MNLPFLLSIFTALLLYTGCGEKLTNKAITSENPKESIIVKDFKDDEAKEGTELLQEVVDSKEESPYILKPSGLSLPYTDGGYTHHGGRDGRHSRCYQVEGNPCDTGEPLPFNEGNIFCEKGRPVCRPNIKELSYFLYIEDFTKSFIEIPTSNASVDSSTISSKYLAGRAPIYDKQDDKVGTCSASFLCMQNQDGIYTDISNYLSVNNGLIISWFTPTTLINLELDSIIHSMVTECRVIASTKVGYNPFYGETFNMIVSSDDKKIYFQLSRVNE